jgi:hypothetical protein
MRIKPAPTALADEFFMTGLSPPLGGPRWLQVVGRRAIGETVLPGDVTMATAATDLSPMKWPTPTEAALKWVDMAQMGCKAWTDACLQVVTTFSAAAQTQAKVFASLKTPAMVTPQAVVEAVMAPIEAAIATAPAPVVAAEVIEAASIPIEVVAVEAAPVVAEIAPGVVAKAEEAPPVVATVAKPAPKIASAAKADKPASLSK